MFHSRSDRMFEIINNSLLSVVFLIVLYPLLFIVVASVSDPMDVALGKIWLIPKGINLNAYKNVFENSQIWVGYGNTIFYTVCGTTLNLVLTLSCAFAMARKGLAGKNWIMGIFAFTMFFHGGLIPSYLLIKQLGMIDTRWALIVPAGLSVYNMVIARTFFQSTIPEEMYDAAKMDGCSDFGIMMRIALPLSAPIIAVMGLFYGVGHWNAFFGALIYLNNRDLYPLQLILRNILIENQQMQIDPSTVSTEQVEYLTKMAFMAETMKYSLIFIASAPVLIVFPFLQRYFVKGVMIGALKG